jgi:hypothetical protein
LLFGKSLRRSYSHSTPVAKSPEGSRTKDRLKRVEEDSETLRARLTAYESALPKTIDDAVSERPSKVAEVSNFFELRDARWALGPGHWGVRPSARTARRLPLSRGSPPCSLSLLSRAASRRSPWTVIPGGRFRRSTGAAQPRGAAHNQAGYRGGFEHVDLRANVLKIVTFCFSVKGPA